jgi:hypothetical protein
MKGIIKFVAIAVFALTAFLAVLALMAIPARAQLFGVPTVTFDPTQAAHVVQQIAKAEQTYTTIVRTSDNVVNAYNLASRMATAPQSLYSGYGSGLPAWVPVIPSNDTYGNTGGYMAAFNRNLGAATSAVQSASVARAAQMTGYNTLDANSQRAIAAKTATLDLGDAVSATNLSAVGAIRSEQAQRQADIAKLEAASHSGDATQQTELATLQRINQALLLLLRTQQDQSQLSQGQTMQQMVEQKQQQDELKLLFLNADGYEANYNSKVSTSGTSITKAFHY